MFKSRSFVSSLTLSLITLLFLVCVTPSAMAQSAQAFVSSNGVDAGNCAAGSPCRTVSYAMTQVTHFGLVLIVDSGVYDSSVQIDRSLTVAAAPGVVALFTAAVTNGTIFTIGGGPSFCNALGVCHSLVLRGLTFDGQSTTQDAVRAGGMRLSVEDCHFRRFRLGIYMNGSGNLNIKRSTFREIDNGIYISPATNNRVISAVVEDSSFEALRNTGVNADTNGDSTIRVSVYSSSFDRAGVAIRSSTTLGGGIQFNVEHCHVAGSATGVLSFNGSSVVRVSNSTIVNNSTGVVSQGGGVLLTRGNNTIEGNNFNGSFTGSFSAH